MPDTYSARREDCPPGTHPAVPDAFGLHADETDPALEGQGFLRRVQHDGLYATVVFVSDGENEEFSPGYGNYAGVERGIVLCDDDGNLNTIGDPDERLQFIDRG